MVYAEAGLDRHVLPRRPSGDQQPDALQDGPKLLVCNHHHNLGKLVQRGLPRQH